MRFPIHNDDEKVFWPNMKRPADPERQRQLQAELRQERLAREKSYRAAAMRLLPHVCARCGREFTGARLRELTVHHKDHNFRNNPPDGSNWELLCLYCHDAEHEKYRLAGTAYGEIESEKHQVAGSPIVTPFAALDGLFREVTGGCGKAGTRERKGDEAETASPESPSATPGASDGI